MSISLSGRKEFQGIDRTAGSMLRGNHTRRPRYMYDRVPFAQCGGCGDRDVFWMPINGVATNVHIRECWTCGERVNLRNSRGNILKFVARR